MRVFRKFCKSEAAQDVVEWALLISLVVLGSASLFFKSGDSVSKVWSATSLAFTDSSTASNPPAVPVTPPSEHHDHDNR